MSDLDVTVNDSQGESSAKPNGGIVSVKERVNGLSALQQDRFYSIYHLYKEGTFDILDHFKNRRSPNQWAEFIEKSDAANQPSNEAYDYLHGVSEAFEEGKPYAKFDIVNMVSAVRTKFNLPTFKKDVTQNSLNELKKVFLTTETEDDDLIPVIAIVAS